MKDHGKAMKGGARPLKSTPSHDARPSKALPTDVKSASVSGDHKVRQSPGAQTKDLKLPAEVEAAAKGVERTPQDSDTKLVGTKGNWMHDMTKRLEKESA